jgi:hypothetical protein
MSKQQLRPSSDRVGSTNWKKAVGGAAADYTDLLTNQGSTLAVISRSTNGNTHDYDWQVYIEDPSHITGELPLTIRIIADVMGYNTGNPINPLNSQWFEWELCTVINSVGVYLLRKYINDADLPNGIWAERSTLELDVSSLAWVDMDALFLGVEGSTTLVIDGGHSTGTAGAYIRNLRLELLSGPRLLVALSESNDTLTVDLRKGKVLAVDLSESNDTLYISFAKANLYVMLTESADTLVVTLVHSVPAVWASDYPVVTQGTNELVVTAVLWSNPASPGGITIKRCQIGLSTSFAVLIADTDDQQAAGETDGQTVTWHVPWANPLATTTFYCRVAFRSAEFPDWDAWNYMYMTSFVMGPTGHTYALTESADTLTVTVTRFLLYALTEAVDTLVLVVDRPWTATTPSVTIMSGQLHVTAVLNAHAGAITAKQCQIAYDSAFATILTDSGISPSTSVANDTVAWYIPWTRSDDDVYFCRVGFRCSEFPNVTIWSPNVDAFSASPLAITASAIQSGENIIFSASVITALHMPPWVTAKVGSTSIVMTLAAESGAGPWTYTFTATTPAETGDVSWYVVAIAADNSITTSIASQTLHMVYAEDPSIGLNTLTGQVSIENAVFTDAPIPACASMTCTIDGIVPMGLATARVSAGGAVKEYRLEATQQSGWPRASVTFRSPFAARLNYPLSGNLASMPAADAINLIASPWRLAGDYASLLTIPWILASVDGEPLAIVLDKIMTMNGVQLWERSGLLYVVPVAPTMATFGVQRGDGYSKDLTMTNHVREWYTIGAYPSPVTLFSNLDSINWTPSPASAILEDTVRPWGTGPLPPSKLGCLGIPKEADRLVSFNLHDYDEFKASWVPMVMDANQVLQVALYSDALNYWYATRPFTEAKGAGWQVTGSNQWDVVQEVVSIASLEVLTVAFDFTSPCRLRVTLHYNSGGSWVSDYVTTDRDGLAVIDVPLLNYNDAHTNLVTSIDVDVTNLYDIGGAYGAECTHMWLTKRVGITTGELQGAVLWSHEYKGISLMSVWSGGNNEVLIAEQPPYPVQRIDPMIFSLWNRHRDPNGLETVTPLIIAPALSIGNMGVILNYSTPGAKPQVDYNSQFDVTWLEYDLVLIAYDLTVYTDHVTYSTIKSEIGATFNLWEPVTIPLSEFVPAGAPTTTIMQMGFRDPGGPLYLDAPHFDVIVPRRGFVDIRDASSITVYGERFEDRRSDNFTTEAQARAYAVGYVAMHCKPRETYGVDLPLTTPLGYLDAAFTPEGAVIPVSAISYDFTRGAMHLALGAPENTLNARLLQQAEHADRIERRIT